jgi:hypothetical protein
MRDGLHIQFLYEKEICIAIWIKSYGTLIPIIAEAFKDYCSSIIHIENRSFYECFGYVVEITRDEKGWTSYMAGLNEGH